MKKRNRAKHSKKARDTKRIEKGETTAAVLDEKIGKALAAKARKVEAHVLANFAEDA